MCHASPESLRSHALELLAELIEERAERGEMTTAEIAALDAAAQIVDELISR